MFVIPRIRYSGREWFLEFPRNRIERKAGRDIFIVLARLQLFQSTAVLFTIWNIVAFDLCYDFRLQRRIFECRTYKQTPDRGVAAVDRLQSERRCEARTEELSLLAMATVILCTSSLAMHNEWNEIMIRSGTYTVCGHTPRHLLCSIFVKKAIVHRPRDWALNYSVNVFHSRRVEVIVDTVMNDGWLSLMMG